MKIQLHLEPRFYRGFFFTPKIYIMKTIAVFLLITISLNAFADSTFTSLKRPLIERYVLDELKALRSQQEKLKTDVTGMVAGAKLESSDRAIEYTTATTNNIFYIITAAASLLVLLGWKSLSDIKSSMKLSTQKSLSDLTQKYEDRLEAIEHKMQERSKVILEAQERISATTQIHSLWMRAGLEKSEEEKINIYDEILELNPNDIEALTYKADSLLEINEVRWALNLSNIAIEKDDEYALAYWQRACAYAQMGKTEDAINDIKTATTLSEPLKGELGNEKHFKLLSNNEYFKDLAQLN